MKYLYILMGCLIGAGVLSIRVAHNMDVKDALMRDIVENTYLTACLEAGGLKSECRFKARKYVTEMP